MRNWTVAAAMLLCVVAHSSARAESPDNYPSRPITVVVPFAAGGPSDLVARVVTTKMSQTLGQPMIIDNRVGAGGAIGTSYVARSPADGYILTVGNPGTHATTPLVQRDVGYDPVNDFTFIAPLGSSTFVLICNPALPAKAAQELFAHAKLNSGKLTYGSAGIGSNVNFIFEYLKQRTGTDFLHVPYKGAGPMITDLLAGTIDCTFDAASKQRIDTGVLRAFAVASNTRDPLYSNVPTLEETGVENFNLSSWQALMGPKRIPEAIVEKLNRAANAAVQDGEAIEKLASTGFHAKGGTSEDLKTIVARDAGIYREIAKSAKMEMQ